MNILKTNRSNRGANKGQISSVIISDLGKGKLKDDNIVLIESIVDLIGAQLEFADEAETEIKVSKGNLDRFEPLFDQYVTAQAPATPTTPKKSTFTVAKGNNVRVEVDGNEVEAVIIKYSSNKEITVEFHEQTAVVSKDDIKAVI